MRTQADSVSISHPRAEVQAPMLEKGPRILRWEKQNGVLRSGVGDVDAAPAQARDPFETRGSELPHRPCPRPPLLTIAWGFLTGEEPATERAERGEIQETLLTVTHRLRVREPGSVG